MKCPKCHYLGWETGDRCKNCGYDFSLLAVASESHARPSNPALPAVVAPVIDRAAVGDDVVDRLAAMPLHRSPIEPQTARAGVTAAEDAAADDLPLFTGRSLEDEPLVRLPAAPRIPLAVRKTPEIPRIRPSGMTRRRDETRADDSFLALADPAVAPAASRPAPAAALPAMETSSSGARAGAALLDLALLLIVDLLIVYFTLRMAALTIGEWRLLPPIPLILFLLLLKVAYYFAFTAIGGQTIGKMAMHIRVVSDEGPAVAPARAFRRTLAAATAIVTLGGTFIPALVGRERRAIHDRVARTRVVALPVA